MRHGSWLGGPRRRASGGDGRFIARCPSVGGGGAGLRAAIPVAEADHKLKIAVGCIYLCRVRCRCSTGRTVFAIPFTMDCG